MAYKTMKKTTTASASWWKERQKILEDQLEKA